MCDFSVVAGSQRDYRSGERLVVTQFGTYTRGTASPGDRSTAVCLRSGVCMMIPKLPKKIRKKLDLPEGELSAIFMQLPNRERAHRDALMFENGRTFLISELPVDLEMTVYERRPDIVRAAVERDERELVAVAATS